VWVGFLYFTNSNIFIHQKNAMKNKIGFNLIFAMIAFPIGLALFRELDLQSFTFKKKALGILYLVTFLVLIFLTLKRNKKPTEK